MLYITMTNINEDKKVTLIDWDIICKSSEKFQNSVYNINI